MKLLYNTAHPLAETGKPIFIPFGEWKYDGKSRQRLDRTHGEKIANELNARVAKGEPGIPVYQGHPDVPALAAKYPDKGALGWVVRAELANEDGKDGLALTVEWDRDPGRGFRWFSPYWLASREGGTYIVNEIASIGLVNNPNIPEFRLANEEQPTMKIKLNPAIIELAAKYDRLANEENFDESKHPRDEDGKFAPAGTATVKKVDPSSTPGSRQEQEKNRQLDAQVAKVQSGLRKFEATERKAREFMMGGKIPWGDRSKATSVVNDKLAEWRAGMRYEPAPGTVPYHHEVLQRTRENIRGLHMAAIKAGLTYNPKTHKYE